METAFLTTPDYWTSPSVDLRVNPKRAVDCEGLHDFLVQQCGITASVVLATSGSGGAAKWVVLSKAAILASARAVNVHCGLCSDDRWLAGLSTFHVGGIGIYARAYENGASLVGMEWDRWTRDGSVFLRAVEDSGATLASLTPTHLHDLIAAEAKAPATLRGLFLGGGTIDGKLVTQARALGWPIWATYGMSETASQVATATNEAIDWLPLLPGWEARITEADRLALRGDALLSGYVTRVGGDWHFDSARDEEGWFVTNDRCELRAGALRFLSREDGSVKVSGELVSLSQLNDRLRAFGIAGYIVALPDPRREHRLVLVREHGGEGRLDAFNAQLAPIEQVGEEHWVATLPRTDVGKPDRQRIYHLAREMVASRLTE